MDQMYSSLMLSRVIDTRNYCKLAELDKQIPLTSAL